MRNEQRLVEIASGRKAQVLPRFLALDSSFWLHSLLRLPNGIDLSVLSVSAATGRVCRHPPVFQLERCWLQHHIVRYRQIMRNVLRRANSDPVNNNDLELA